MPTDAITNMCSRQEHLFDLTDRGTGYDRSMATPAIEHRHLRSALEFAVLMAREGRKFKPPMKYPKGLDAFIKMPRVPNGSLGSLRRLVESDDAFRTRIAAGALPELVDPIGKLWLERPPGWEDELDRLVGEAAAAEQAADLANQLKRAEKRRDAAEQVAARSRAELVVLQEQLDARALALDELRADVVKLDEALDELRAELIDTRNEARHARDRELAAIERLRSAEAELAVSSELRADAEVVRDDVLADRAELAADRSELARLAAAAGSLAEQLAALAIPRGAAAPKQVRRTALPMPGGIVGHSGAAAEYLMRSGASVVVDGYNVAKRGWPDLELAAQRTVLLDAIENVARRFGSDITVVFDGADVVGASAAGRRVVRVVYSPADVIADDVIRDEVRRLPPSRPVVVATNDREVLRDVKALGANTLSSDQLLALVR
jgi:predicted RNA-binding protein with PIN domain